MSYRLIIRPLAELDLKEAMDWYNIQVDGLGNKFLERVDQKLKTLVENPHLFKRSYKGIRTAHLNKFPFKIFFEISSSKITVLAFYHTSRNTNKLLIKRL